MSFEEILNKAFAMLRRRGRMSHRAMRRHLGPEKATVEDLNAELIARPLVKEGEHRGVSSPGEVSPIQEKAHRPTPYASKGASLSEPRSKGVPIGPHLPEAERRQLTVLFCDIVDSTTLSGLLDPEDLREVIRAYQGTCAEIVERFEGSIAQYLGDGILAYFSYPQAHEDDAQRAVHAGLEIIRALAMLNARLSQEHRIQLAVRIGIHTGLVVVGEIGQRHEYLALGETPNIAARLQNLATPNTVVISAATCQLIQREFDTDDLGLHSLKGTSTPIPLYRVVSAKGTTGGRDTAQPRGPTPSNR